MSDKKRRTLRTDHVLSLGQVFKLPLLLGIATAIGLVSALMGDAGWDVLSWLTLLGPIVAMAVAWRRRD